MKKITVRSKPHGTHNILVDDEDYPKVSRHTWSLVKREHTFYCYTHRYVNGKRKGISIHRFIMGVTDRKIEVDHEDHDGLNNQRHNLRTGTTSQNAMNRQKHLSSATSKYLGVSKKTQTKHFKRVDGGVTTVTYEWWRACITIEGKAVSKMGFKTEIDAAKWRDELAKKHHGEFANLNFKD